MNHCKTSIFNPDRRKFPLFTNHSRCNCNLPHIKLVATKITIQTKYWWSLMAWWLWNILGNKRGSPKQRRGHWWRQCKQLDWPMCTMFLFFITYDISFEHLQLGTKSMLPEKWDSCYEPYSKILLKLRVCYTTLYVEIFPCVHPPSPQDVRNPVKLKRSFLMHGLISAKGC